jgi:RNA polymerase sigma factor (sigma-70 family)
MTTAAVEDLESTKGRSTILFLAANPMMGCELKLDEECRAIENHIAVGAHRDRLRFCSRWAVRANDVLLGFLQHKPAVLHFSGHGGADAGLWLQGENGEPKTLTTDMLDQMMCAGGDGIKAVVLNACYSVVQAQAVVAHVPCVVGMPHVIADAAAIAYAGGFYQAISFGQSLAGAHQYGLAALINAEEPMVGCSRDVELADAKRSLQRAAPVLLIKTGVDANQVFVVTDPTPPDPPPSPPCMPQVHLELKIDRPFGQVDAVVLAAMIAEIRRLSGGGAVRIVCIAEGSVRLTVSLSPEAAALLLQLRSDGRFSALCGAPVVAVTQMAQIAGRATRSSVRVAPKKQYRTAVREVIASAVDDSMTRLLRSTGTDTVNSMWSSAGDPSAFYSTQRLPAGAHSRPDSLRSSGSIVDEDVRALVASGDTRRAMEALMARHGSSIYRYCRESLRDASLADDVMQQVFLQAFRDIHKTTVVQSIRVWLFAIARHRVLDAARARARAFNRLMESDGTNSDVATSGYRPDELLSDAQVKDALFSALDELDPVVREAILLHYHQGLSFVEMAEVMRDQPNRLAARVAKALPRLRRAIERRLGRSR